MTLRSILLTMSFCWLSSVLLTAQATEDEFVSMFNGHDLTGWEGLPEFWKVKDGAIVGETKKPNDQTLFLYWKGGEPADFDLRCRLRIAGEGANSGIQIRSQRRPNWDALGYQADFDESGYCVGSLYVYGRKPLAAFARRGETVQIDSVGNRSVQQFEDPTELLSAYKKGEWNDYRIVAKGRQVTVWLNGALMCTVEDRENEYFSPKGIVALQLHSGAPMRVAFKDLRIRLFEK